MAGAAFSNLHLGPQTKILESAWRVYMAFRTAEPTPSDTLPPARLHLLNLPQTYQPSSILQNCKVQLPALGRLLATEWHLQTLLSVVSFEGAENSLRFFFHKLEALLDGVLTSRHPSHNLNAYVAFSNVTNLLKYYRLSSKTGLDN